MAVGKKEKKKERQIRTPRSIYGSAVGEKQQEFEA